VDRAAPLKPREMEVLLGLARGESYCEIAERLHLAVSTIRNYGSQAFHRLGVPTAAAAVWRVRRELEQMGKS